MSVFFLGFSMCLFSVVFFLECVLLFAAVLFVHFCVWVCLIRVFYNNKRRRVYYLHRADWWSSWLHVCKRLDYVLVCLCRFLTGSVCAWCVCKLEDCESVYMYIYLCLFVRETSISSSLCVSMFCGVFAFYCLLQFCFV